MDAFQDFIASDAFFPVFIGILVLLVAIFLWILFSGRKKIKNINNVEANNAQVSNVASDLPSGNEVLEINPLDELNKTTAKKEEEQVATLEASDVAVNIPINTMDESPVDVYVPTSDVEDIGEEIEIEMPKPMVEENVAEDQIVNIELPTKRMEDVGEPIELPVAKAQVIEEQDDMVELPIAKEVVKEFGEEAVAFASVPEEIRDINANVRFEQKPEYTGEKTEKIDFSVLNQVNNTNNALNNNIPKEVVSAPETPITSA